MKKIEIAVLLCVLVLTWYSHAGAMQMEGCGAGECKDCHSLTVKEASQIFKGFVDKVIETKESRVPGLWEVTVKKGKKKGTVLIDYSKSYIIDGKIIPIKEKIKLDFSKIPLKNSIIVGNPEAADKVVVFTDPDCAFCVKLHKEIKKIVKDKKKDIAFYIKLNPLRSIHPDAYDKSKVIICSSTPLTLLEHVFEGKKIALENVCKTSVVDENLKLAQSLGIKSTPTMVLQNGRIIRGYKDASAIVDFVKSAHAAQEETKEETKDDSKKNNKKDSKNK